MATETTIAPQALDVGPDGSMYFYDYKCDTVRRIAPDGIVTTVAGNGDDGFSGDGGPALEAKLSSYVDDIKIAPDGLYIADSYNRRLRRVDLNGIIDTVAGNGSDCDTAGSCGEGGPMAAAQVGWIDDMAFAPDGALYLASKDRIRRIGAALPGYTGDDVVIASADGGQLYAFDKIGRHQETVDTVTGATLYEFGYDSDGLLETVTDVDGLVTTINRDADGDPTSICGPYGHCTDITLDSNGYLDTWTNPEDETYDFDYTAEGLLTKAVTPYGNATDGYSAYQYDNETGYLIRAENPVGGVVELSRVATTGNYTRTVTITRTRAAGVQDVSVYLVENLPDGTFRRTTQHPNGSSTVSELNPDGTEPVTFPDGTVRRDTYCPDPRFKLQATYVCSQTRETAGGDVFWTRRVTKTVALTDTFDLLSLETLTVTEETNGRVSTSVYDEANDRWVHTLPTGQVLTETLDAKGRVVLEERSGLADASYSYNATTGQLESITQGSGAAARTITRTYDANSGLLDTVTYPDGGVYDYDYDDVGRITSISKPGGLEEVNSYSNGLITYHTNEQGIVTTYDYDYHDRMDEEVTFDDVDGGREVSTPMSMTWPTTCATSCRTRAAGKLNVTTVLTLHAVLDSQRPVSARRDRGPRGNG